MGSRKENLKKSLGISEYPWSSDEEDNSTSQPVPVLRRQSDEARPSGADTPGTSMATVSGVNSSAGGNAGSSGHSSGQGPQSTQPSTPATVRRQQAKMDRELFWSIINNSPRPVTVSGCPARSRVDVPLTHVTRPQVPSRSEISEARRTERSPADIQRILAFKRLTRNLSLRQSRHNASIQATNSRRVPSGPCSSRSTLFSPELAAAAAASAARARAHSCCSRSSPSRSSQPGSPRSVAEGSSSVRYRGVMTRTPSGFIIGNASRSQLIPSEHFVNVEQSDEEAEPVPDAPPAEEQPVVNNAEGGNDEAPTNNTSAGDISLEEIVEIDAPDEPDTPLAAETETDTAEPHINNEGNAVATNSDENTEASQQQSPFHGVKRKRETSDENAEPYSVQEFNQSLLRLLECPVCLEWMEPPISQCRRGHLVCSRCRTRLASCPVCRTTFSSVRNRAMEGVAEMLRYPCRHGCGREVRLRRRAPHEASCGARRYHCPAPPCARHPPLAHHELAHHFQCKHLPILKIGRKHKFSMKVNSEQHDTWLIMALDEYFHLRVDVDIRTWGVIVYVAYIGPKRKAKHYTYEVTVEGQHNSRSLKYARATHSDLESSSLNVSRQDCFHLTLDQALNFLRFKNRHCEPDKFLDFDVEIDKCQNANAHESKDESDS